MSLAMKVHQAAVERFGNKLYGRYGDAGCKKLREAIGLIEKQIEATKTTEKTKLEKMANDTFSKTLKLGIQANKCFGKMEKEVGRGRVDSELIDKSVQIQNHAMMLNIRMDELQECL